MAAFNTLTPEQQAQVLAFNVDFRAEVSLMAKTLNRLQAINEDYVGIIGPILSGVDVGELLPADASGLNGIAPLTPFIIGSIISDIQALLVTYTAAKRQVWVGACGPTNMTG